MVLNMKFPLTELIVAPNQHEQQNVEGRPLFRLVNP
jgi:hypothetical protein